MRLASLPGVGRHQLERALRQFSSLLEAPPPAELRPAAPPELVEIPDFGPNPGRLGLYGYAAAGLSPGRPLVLLLHGCGQSAAGFAAGSGWLDAAARLGIAVVAAEQRRANHHAGCFHWFRSTDTARERGEAASIRAMVATAAAVYGSDPARIFVLGLSAGGAMAASVLAAYPELFAGGAIIAGLPAGAAHSFAHGVARMADAGPPPATGWAEVVRAAAPAGHAGPWPRLTIWHGAADTTVDPANAENLVRQWTGVHGLDIAAGRTDRGGLRRSWGHRDRPAVEAWIMPGMGHGLPVAAARADGYFLEADIDATAEIARFWRLAD